MDEAKGEKGSVTIKVEMTCVTCGEPMEMRTGGTRSDVYFACESCGNACYFMWENGYYPLSYEKEKNG